MTYLIPLLLLASDTPTTRDANKLAVEIHAAYKDEVLSVPAGPERNAKDRVFKAKYADLRDRPIAVHGTIIMSTIVYVPVGGPPHSGPSGHRHAAPQFREVAVQTDDYHIVYYRLNASSPMPVRHARVTITAPWTAFNVNDKCTIIYLGHADKVKKTFGPKLGTKP